MEALGADGDINGYQLFIYCMNDPVNNRDEAGSWSLPNWAKVAIGAALIVGAAVVATVATGGVACFAAGAALAQQRVRSLVLSVVQLLVLFRAVLKLEAGIMRLKLLLMVPLTASLVVLLAVSLLAALPVIIALLLAR